jgi:hypothetical protein
VTIFIQHCQHIIRLLLLQARMIQGGVDILIAAMFSRCNRWPCSHLQKLQRCCNRQAWGGWVVLTSVLLAAAMSFLALQQVAIFTSANASTVLQQAGLGRLEVVLCSYDQLRLHGRELADQLAPHVVIFDEVMRSLGFSVLGGVCWRSASLHSCG